MKPSLPHHAVAIAFLAVFAPACAVAPDASDEALASETDALGACLEQPLAIAAATASSEQNGGYFSAASAIDANNGSRWSSVAAQGAPQWLRLDFGQRKFISALNIYWETAFSPSYEIQASDDGVNWAVVRSLTNDKPGLQVVSKLDVTARYVRIFARVMSGYGSVSIVDVYAFGDSAAACVTTPASCGQTTRLTPALVQATSQEFPYTPAAAAVDGSYSSRWSSAFSDEQSLTLDLGAVARVDSLRVTWEAAYATKYTVEAGPSLTGPWSVVARNDSGRGGVETVSVGTSTRYLRLHGIQRATGYGYSIWELDVFGSKDTNCSPNLLTRGWDPAASTNNIGVSPAPSVPGLYTIDPNVLNRIDLSQSGQYCPVGGPGYLTFTQHVTVPAAGSKFHLVLDIPRDNGSVSFVVAGASLGGVQGSNFTPNPELDYQGNPVARLDGTGKIEADFLTNLAASQNVDLTIKLAIIGAGIPNTNCGVMLQSYTLGSATLTRTN